MVSGQVKAERCVARTTIPSIYLIASILGEFSCSRKKALKSGYEILTASLTKFEKQGFSSCLFPVHFNTHLGWVVVLKVIWVGAICPVISFCIHHYTYQTLWNVSQEEVIRRKTTEPSGDGENLTIHSANGVLGRRLL